MGLTWVRMQASSRTYSSPGAPTLHLENSAPVGLLDCSRIGWTLGTIRSDRYFFYSFPFAAPALLYLTKTNGVSLLYKKVMLQSYTNISPNFKFGVSCTIETPISERRKGWRPTTWDVCSNRRHFLAVGPIRLTLPHRLKSQIVR